MRKAILTALLAITTATAGFAQSEVVIHDTRNVNDLPSFVQHRLRLDFKWTDVVGLPFRSYSTSMTLSPWKDRSGGLVHQLSFNDVGIHYRNAAYGDSPWNPWREVVVKTPSGSVEMDAGSSIGYALHNTLNHNGHQLGQYSLCWVWDSWQTGSPTMWMGGHGGVKMFTGGKLRLAITNGGCVGIGTETPEHSLDVVGTIRAHQVLVNTQKGADFVFEEGYPLPPLEEVERYIAEHKHLPEILPAKAMVENGVDMGALQVQLLQKVEELTLYVIQLEKKSNSQVEQIEQLNNQLLELKASLK